MKGIHAVLAATLIVLTGCHSYDVNGTAPVRYASGVQVIMLDRTKRDPSPTIETFESAADVKRPYHAIAILSREGYLRDGQMIVNAILWRARMAGANGVILLGVGSGNTDPGFIIGNGNGLIGRGSNTESLFSARAIVFDN